MYVITAVMIGVGIITLYLWFTEPKENKPHKKI